MPVSHHRNDQILRPDTALDLQPLGQLGVHGHLLLSRPALLEDLNDHNAVRTLESEPGVLSDNLTLVVLGDDLIAITGRSPKHVEHDILDSVSQPAEFLERSALLDINTDKRHVSPFCGRLVDAEASNQEPYTPAGAVWTRCAASCSRKSS